MRIHRTPALSDSAPLRYFTFGTLYFAQGIPQGLQLYAIPAWMALNGAEAPVVGSYVAICTLPWAFKLVNKPADGSLQLPAHGAAQAMATEP